jgi:hypothetical protein
MLRVCSARCANSSLSQLVQLTIQTIAEPSCAHMRGARLSCTLQHQSEPAFIAAVAAAAPSVQACLVRLQPVSLLHCL